MSRKSDIAKLERIAALIAGRLPVKEANAMRNVIVHNYEGVNFRIVTRTLQDDFPRLKAAVLSILAADPSSSQ